MASLRDKNKPTFSALANAIAKRGLYVLPVGIEDRKPLCKWDSSTLDFSQFKDWQASYGDSVSPGIVVGKEYGDTWAIDIDEPDYVTAKLPKTLTVRSGGGGLHLYFKHDDLSREKIASLGNWYIEGSNGRDKALEVFGSRHTLHGPGAVHHKTGNIYKIEQDAKVSAAPRAFVDYLVEQAKRAKVRTSERDFSKVIAGLVLKPGKTPEELADALGLVFKGDKLHPAKAEVCPSLGSEHNGGSNTVWLFFYDDGKRTVQFYCGGGRCKDGAKKGRTQKALEARGLKVDEWFDRPAVGRLVANSPITTELADRLEDVLLSCEGSQAIYQRGDSLVRVTQQKEIAEGAVKREDDADVLSPADELYIQRALNDSGEIGRVGKDDAWTPTDAPMLWCRHVLNRVRTDAERTRWPHLEFVSNTPIVLADGSVIETDGYHAGIFLQRRGVEFPKIGDGEKAAREAVKVFDRVYGRFPFVSRAAYSSVLAAHLSILVRNLLSTVPALAITAPTIGSGKTKIAECIAIGTTGRTPPAFSFDGKIEFDKALVETLLSGDRVTLIDNVTQDHVFDSSRLNSALTASGILSWRILCSNDHHKLLNRSQFIVTGNNLLVGGELTRRFIWTEIDPNTARPQDRVFDFDPVKRTREIWPELVSAGLTMVRAYLLQKRKRALPSLGSFESWSGTVRDTLAWLGFPDVVDTQRGAPEDPEQTKNATILQTWFRQYRDKILEVKDIRDGGGDTARLFQNKNGILEPISVGIQLARMRLRVYGGFKLIRYEGSKTKPKGWQVVEHKESK